jgi:aminoglycoside phosphotransferase (APT) family kinase protein
VTSAELRDALAALAGCSVEEVQGLHRLTGGGSREAWAFDLEDGTSRHPLILMRYPAAGLLRENARHEFQVLETASTAGVRSPTPLWLDASGTTLGRPGFVMERAGGSSDVRSLEDSQRSGLDRDMVSALTSLHQVEDGSTFDPRDAVDEWVERAPELARTGEPSFVWLAAWLRAHAPAPRPAVLVHGDFRYGNVLHDGGRLTAVLDWELAHYGDPVEDLAWLYRPFRRTFAPFTPMPRLVELYEEASGSVVDRDRLGYFRIFSELKSMAIWLTGLSSVRSGGDFSVARALQLVSYSARQALLWVEEVEQAC